MIDLKRHKGSAAIPHHVGPSESPSKKGFNAAGFRAHQKEILADAERVRGAIVLMESVLREKEALARSAGVLAEFAAKGRKGGRR